MIVFSGQNINIPNVFNYIIYGSSVQEARLIYLQCDSLNIEIYVSSRIISPSACALQSERVYFGLWCQKDHFLKKAFKGIYRGGMVRAIIKHLYQVVCLLVKFKARIKCHNPLLISNPRLYSVAYVVIKFNLLLIDYLIQI